jgi:hypothetical protein
MQIGSAVLHNHTQKLIEISHELNDEIRMSNGEGMPKSE